MIVLWGAAGRSGALEWGQGQGNGLFLQLNLLLFSLIWILVPLVCFDAVSRERREGTLSLLFLTPLRPIDVLMAKGFLHGLRIAVCLLATIPIMMVPFLLGGVTLLDALRMFFLDASAGILAWFATMVASVRCRSAASSLAWSLSYSVILFGGLGVLYVSVSIWMFLEQSGLGWERESVLRVSKYFFQKSWDRLPFNQSGLTFSIAPFRSGATGGGAGWSKVLQAAGLCMGSIVFVMIGLRYLARSLRESVWMNGDGRNHETQDSSLFSRVAWINGLQKRNRWQQVVSLIQRYQIWRFAFVVFIGVGVLGGYWWIKFASQPLVFREKLVLLVFLSSCTQVFIIGWLVAEERRSGMLELMFLIPQHFSWYCLCLFGISFLPVVLPWSILFGCLIAAGDRSMAVQISLTFVNASGLACIFAWRAMSVPSGVGLSILLIWLLPWVLGVVFDVREMFQGGSGLLYSVVISVLMGTLFWRLRVFGRRIF